MKIQEVNLLLYYYFGDSALLNCDFAAPKTI